MAVAARAASVTGGWQHGRVRPAGTRIVQLSDTHLSARQGVPAQWPSTLAWLRADPPALVVHSGDIVLEDPDDAADRDFARRLLAAIPSDVVVIPGNHDVGDYRDERAVIERRVDDVPPGVGRRPVRPRPRRVAAHRGRRLPPR